MSYEDPCPKCGARLIDFTKEDFIEHLRENGETLAAMIYEDMIVEEDGCADEYPGDVLENCADANGGESL